jgi:DNA end-binding protein Ku
MPARPLWKAVIRCDEEHFPVKLYSALENQSVHFYLLHAKTHARVQQRLATPATSETVEKPIKGYEVERDVFVPLTADELDELAPRESREIHIFQFVELTKIEQQWFVRPYWLGPDGREDDYFAFARALEETNRVGIARWVMRKKEYVGALLARDGYLMLHTLRHNGEVIEATELEPPAGRDLSEKEFQLATQLVDALADTFKADDYHDEHRERVLELIETKRTGKTLKIVKYVPKQEPDSLAAVLKKSLQGL